MLEKRIRIDRGAAAGGEVHIEWTCFSPSLPGGKGHGLNRFTLQDGLIVSLVMTLREGEAE